MALERYYLGAEPGWLSNPPPGLPANVGLFVSHARLSRRERDYNCRLYKPATVTGWALDSGGFSQLDRHGRYTFLPAEYVWALRRYDAEIGRLEWAAPMDWMCEPEQLAKTGLTVREHQRLTVENYLELCDLWWQAEDVRVGIRRRIPGYRSDRDPEMCPIKPALQGYQLREYLDCVDMYEEAGVHLNEHTVVGVGSVCRRSNTREGVELFRGLAYELQRLYPSRIDEHGTIRPGGCDLHAFGVTTLALADLPGCVITADSHAWSLDGRYAGRCQHPGSGVDWETNCPLYAMEWLARSLRGVRPASLPSETAGGQFALDLFGGPAA